MKYEETYTHGSFKIWGTGFWYEYHAKERLLNIGPLDDKRILACLKFDAYLAGDAPDYVHSLDKTNQIKALMYSNNETNDLSQIMAFERLEHLIAITAHTSRLAFDLHTRNFERFSSIFCKDFDLKTLLIKPFSSRDHSTRFYVARMQTHHNNSIHVRACTLEGLTSAMAERTIRDLMTMEYGRDFNNSAHVLLNASSKLATISRILDENFIPEHKLKAYEMLKNQQNPFRERDGSTD